MIFPLSCPESLRVITAQTLPKVTISNDQVPGPQLNAPGVYKKINSFDQACFQSQWLIDKIQCASLYLFMVGTELFLNYFMIILAPMVFHHLADSYYLETEVLLEDNNRKYKKVVLNKNYKTFDINNNIYLFLFYSETYAVTDSESRCDPHI